MRPYDQYARFEPFGNLGKRPCRISIGYLQYPRNSGMEKCFFQTLLHVIDLLTAALIALRWGQTKEIRVVANSPLHQGRTRDHIDANQMPLQLGSKPQAHGQHPRVLMWTNPHHYWPMQWIVAGGR